MRSCVSVGILWIWNALGGRGGACDGMYDGSEEVTSIDDEMRSVDFGGGCVPCTGLWGMQRGVGGVCLYIRKHVGFRGDC
jgi:hypothetical protein